MAKVKGMTYIKLAQNIKGLEDKEVAHMLFGTEGQPFEETHRQKYLKIKNGDLQPDEATAAKLLEVLGTADNSAVELENVLPGQRKQPTVGVLDVLQEMTPEELEERERIIAEGMQMFIIVGEALAEIRERKGYKHNYGTFEEYCRQRWSLTARHCRNLIGASKAATLAEQSGKSLSQTAAQHIATLETEQQIEFIRKHDADQMTAREVEQAVKEYKQRLTEANDRISELQIENTELQTRSLATVTQEVVPEDYEATKLELTSLKLIQSEAESKVETVAKTRREITEEVVLVAMRINEFIKEVANAVFLVQAADNFGETESMELDASLKLLEEWFTAMRGVRTAEVILNEEPKAS